MLFWILVNGLETNSQCLNASFSLPDSACTSEEISISSNLSAQDSVEWTFCTDSFDLDNYSDLGNIGSIMTTLEGITMPVWGDHMFIKSNTIHQLYRFDFSHLDSVPTAHGVTVNGPTVNGTTDSDIKFVKYNGNYYGFTSARSGNIIYRYDFGSDLTADSVVGSNLGNLLGDLSAVRDIDIKIHNDSFYLAAINLNGQFVIYNLGNSPLNAPVWSKTINLNSGGNPMSSTVGIKLISQCNKLYAFVSGQTSNGLSRLDFGTTPWNSPNIESIPNPGGWTRAYSPQLIFTRGHWRLILKSNNPNTLVEVQFQDSVGENISNIEVKNFTQSANIVNSKAIAIRVIDSAIYTFTLNNSRNKLIRFKSNFDCSVSIVDSNSFTPTISFADTGWQFIHLRVCDSSQCVFNSDSIYLRPGINASFTAANHCFGDSGIFSNTTTSFSQESATFQWNFGDSQSSNDSMPEHLYASSDTFIVSLSATSSLGCSDTFLAPIVVVEQPQITVSEDTSCQGDSIVFNGNVVSEDPIQSLIWEFGNGDSLSGETPIYAYYDADSFLVHARLTTITGCYAEDSAEVIVLESPIAAFSADKTCLTDQTEFTNGSYSSLGFTSVWYFGDGDSSNNISPAHTYPDTGFYTATLITNSNNGCGSQDSTQIQISPTPLVTIDLNSHGHCQGEEIEVERNVSSIHPVNQEIFAFNSDTILNPAQFVTTEESGLTVFYHSVNVGTACIVDTLLSININKKINPTLAVLDSCIDQKLRVEAILNTADTSSVSLISWSFSNGEQSNGYGAATQFDTVYAEISLVTLSDSGCVSQSDTALLLNPIASINFQFSEPFCSDLFIENKTAVLSNDEYQEYWSVVDHNGQPQEYGNRDSIRLGAAGTNLLIDSVITLKGCYALDTFEIYVDQSPELELKLSDACFGVPISMQDNYNGSNYKRQWNFGDGVASNLDRPIYVYSDTGVYEVFLTTIDVSTGCFDSITDQVTIVLEPTVSINEGTFCTNSKLSLEAIYYLDEKDTMDNISWYDGNTLIGVGDSINWISQDTILTFKTLLETELGCSNEEEHTIKINKSPIIELGASDSIGKVPFTTSLSTKQDTTYSYAWIMGVDTLSTDYMLNMEILKAVSHSVELSIQDGSGCISSRAINIQGHDGFADIALSGIEYSAADSGKVFFFATNVGAIPITELTYELRIGSGSTIRNSVALKLFPNETERLEFRGGRIIPASGIKHVCIEAMELGNLIDSDSSNNRTCYLIEIDFMNPYPNPAKNWVHIGFNIEERKSLNAKIIDARGRSVYNEVFTKSAAGFYEERIDVHGIAPGMYYLQLFFGDENGQVFKIQKL